MLMGTPYRIHFAGQNDVQPNLHIPMVYETVPSSQPRWEYRVLSVDTREDALPENAYLDELGTEGWLLVGVLEQRRTERGSQVHYYFVRQKEA